MLHNILGKYLQFVKLVLHNILGKCLQLAKRMLHNNTGNGLQLAKRMLSNILGKCPDPFCQQEAIWHLAWISTVHTVVCMKQKSLNGSLCETSSWKETGCLCETSSWKETGTSAAHILWHWQGKGLLSCKHYITNHKFFCSSRELPRPPRPPPPTPKNNTQLHNEKQENCMPAIT